MRIYEESDLSYDDFLDAYGATSVAVPAPYGTWHCLVSKAGTGRRAIDTSTEKPWKPIKYNRVTGEWEDK